jgi:8-oxo-dGTP pyrophosphatase MutT (NUDIX family)
MLVRNCAGGVVFYDNKVFLLKNEKGEWVLPKGVMRNGDLSNEVALRKVQEETGITAEIISTAGRTNYEFFSVSRQRPVCNKITWYIMKSPDSNYKVSEAMSRITYSQDKSLLNLSYSKLKEAE